MAKFPVDVDESVTIAAPRQRVYAYLWDVVGTPSLREVGGLVGGDRGESPVVRCQHGVGRRPLGVGEEEAGRLESASSTEKLEQGRFEVVHRADDLDRA